MKRLLVPFGLVCVCSLSFATGLTSPLTHYDDPFYLSWNVELLGRPGLAGLLAVWDSTRAWQGEFLEFFPLRDSVYWAVFQLAGLDSAPYHLASLGFHALATLLAHRLCLRIGASAWVAAVAAFLFAAHPIHVESVVWAAALKDPMYTSLLFGSLLAYARYRERPTPWLYLLSLALMIGSLLCKSMALGIPLLMLALERWVGRPTPWPIVLRRLWGPTLFSALFLAQFTLIGAANHVLSAPHGGSWVSHGVLAAWAQVRYLQQAIVPATFRLIYCFEPPSGPGDPRLLAFAALAVAAGLLALAWRRQPLRLFCLVWYAVCLAPVANLVPFPAVMADRYLYAASFGVCLLAAEGLSRLRGRRIVAPGVVAILVAATAARSAVWQDEDRLWEEPDEDPACLVDTSEQAATAHQLRFYWSKDRTVALAALDRALATPGVVKMGPTAFCEMTTRGAREASAIGEVERADRWAELAVRACPDDPVAWNSLMLVNLRRRPDRAAFAAERAWRLDRAPHLEVLVGLTLLDNGEAGGAERVRRAVERAPHEACPVLQQWVEEHGGETKALDGVVQGCR